MPIEWSPEQLRAAGINRRKLESLLKHFARCEQLMKELDLTVYGSDGTGHLIHASRPEHDENYKADLGAVVATIGQGYDGGGW